MKHGNRLIVFGLSVALIFATMTGCSKDKGADTKDDTQKTSTTEKSNEKSEGKKQKLLVGLTQSSFVTDYDDNYFTKYLEDKLGFELEFYMLPTEATETRTKVALMATSNDELPDVLVLDGHLTNEMILQYGSSGFFLPLNEYLADPSKMPNYNAIPEEDRKKMDDAQTMADGNMYSLSAFEPETWNLTPYRTFINREWLDKLGLKVPTTTQELKDVLIAFRDKDPNGNGVKDEIGVYGCSSAGYGQNVSVVLMNTFEFWNGGGNNGGLALDEDGKKVIAPFTTNGWRDGLRYMNDLFKEGVLSANIFTDDETQFKAILNLDTPIVGFTSFGSLSSYPDAVNNKNFLQMQMIEPLKGPNGVQFAAYNEYSPSQELMILKGTDKLDMALKFADQFFDHDTSLIERFGEEGVDWSRDPEMVKKHTNAYVEAGLYDSLTMVVTSSVWMDKQKQSWRNAGPRYASVEMGNTVFDFSSGRSYDPDDPTQLNAKNYELYYPRHPKHILSQLKYTLDEATAIQDPITTIPDFVKQSLAEFVTGARDVESGWDTYLEELDNMGLQQWLKAAQAAYDRK